MSEIEHNEELSLRLQAGLEHLRKLRSAVTQPRSNKESRCRAWQNVQELLTTMETIITCSETGHPEEAKALTKLLNYELTLFQDFNSYEAATMYGSSWGEVTITLASRIAESVREDPTGALEKILLHNGLFRIDPDLLLNPETLVVSPLSSDRLMLGVLRRGLRYANIDCFNLATVALSTNARTIVYPENALKRCHVKRGDTVMVLCDQVVNGRTAGAIHKDLRKRTSATIISGAEQAKKDR